MLTPNRPETPTHPDCLSEEGTLGSAPEALTGAPLEGVALTPAAAAHITQNLQKRGRGLGVRLGVRASGCSGLAYKIEYADDERGGESAFESQGVRLLIDAQSLPYLNGSVLDYRREGLNAGLTFTNPNEQGRCGCGESFRV